MRSTELIKRNLKEVWRDPISLGVAIVLPLLLLLVFQALGSDESSYFHPTRLAPGIALFGFVMLMFSAALTLAGDRENALLDRFLTTPLRSTDFLTGYSAPYVVVALVQSVTVFVIAAFLGLENNGSLALLAAILVPMAVFYVAMGMILGSVFSVAQVTGGYTVVLLLTIFGGAWFDLAEIGGAFETVAGVLPFKHALDSSRAVLTEGAGFSDIAGDLGWVLGYALVATACAVIVFKRRMAR